MEPADAGYERILDRIAWAVYSGHCVLFLGPACSETKDLRRELGLVPSEVPTHKMLICKLAEALGDEGLQERIEQVCGEYPDCSRCILPEVAEQYQEAHKREQLRAFIHDLLEEGEPRQFHRQLWNLPFAAIYTINYDELIIKARKGAVGVVTEDKVFATVSLPMDYEGIPFYKLHGSMDADDVVITVDDQHELKLARQQSSLWKRLRFDLQSKVFLFVGYALGDVDVMEIVYSVHKETRGQRPLQSYAVIEKPMPWHAKRQMEKYRIQIIQENTNRFFENLVERYQYLQKQWSQRLPTTPLEQRYPTVWQIFDQIVRNQSPSGLSLYGLSTQQGEKKVDPVKVELKVIPTEMYEECKQRQRTGKKILRVRLDFDQLGIIASIDSWRSVELLQEMVRQLENERTEVHLDDLKLIEKLDRDIEGWKHEVWTRQQKYWNEKYKGDEEQLTKVKAAVDNPSREQAEMNRKISEHYLASQVSEWLDWELGSNASNALDGYRLIVFITDFHLIEADNEWFGLVNQHFLNILYKYNVGVIITRQHAEGFSVVSKFSSYNLNQFHQIDLGKLVEGVS